MYPDQPQLNTESFGGNQKDVDTATKRSAHIDAETERANRELTKSSIKSTNAGESTPKDFERKLAENMREGRSAKLVHNKLGLSVAHLEGAAEQGYPTEVSGDALARAKKGQTPKLHRS